MISVPVTIPRASERAREAAPTEPVHIPLREVRVGQLFVPAVQADVVCALLHRSNWTPLSTDNETIAVVCIAARDSQLCGLTVNQAPTARVRIVECAEAARYVYASLRA